MINSMLQPSFANLKQLHTTAIKLFPHEYLDAGLNAVGIFLHDPPKHAGYRQTPVNTTSFASIGIDGIHFGLLTDGDNFDSDAPVVMTIPMALEEPNYIVGENLYDFLCLGCRRGYSELGNLHLDKDATLDRFDYSDSDIFDDRVPQILGMLERELLLKPWRDVHGRFADLQRRFMPRLVLPESPTD